MIQLGNTNKTEAQLGEFLRSIRYRFTAETYDLISNNCNNFSDEVSRFLLDTGIPSHIIDLPRIVFSTPGGALLRPMIEGMQGSIRAQQQGSLDPFGGGGPGGTLPLPMTAPPTTGSFSEVSMSQHISSGGVTSREASAAADVRGAAVAAPVLAAAHSGVSPTIPLEDKPLVSSDRDPQVLRGLLAKILKVTGSTGGGLSGEEMGLLQSSVQILCEAPSAVLPAFQNAAFALLGRVLEAYPALHMSCLFIMRLQVLSSAGIDASTARPVLAAILRRLGESSKPPPPSHAAGDYGFATIPGLVMAYCTLANLVSHREGCLVLFSSSDSSHGDNAEGERHLGNVIDAAMWGLCHSRLEVRQISSALAYNLTLASTFSGPGGKWGAEATAGVTLQWRSLHVRSDYTEPHEAAGQGGAQAQDSSELHPHIVQLLCGSMEDMHAEEDPTTLRRRMLTAYRACRAGGEQARELGLALGFDTVVCEVRARVTARSEGSPTGKNDDTHNICVHLENFFNN